MTDPKPTYTTTAAETDPAQVLTVNYWQKALEVERHKSADNLRLAAERASEIADLKQELNEAKKEIERLTRLLDLELSNE